MSSDLRFCLCDAKQRKTIDAFRLVKWNSFDGDSDYIYSRESLSRLSGRISHSKKNHVNLFQRTYGQAECLPIEERILPDALKVAEDWLAEHADDDAIDEEWGGIQKAAEHWRELNMLGVIVYVDGEPAAMNMSSLLSSQCIDTHFEKATAKFSAAGAYAVVNQRFAASEEIAEFAYINREEDMGIPGLKRAKKSYHPNFKLKKYYGEEVI